MKTLKLTILLSAAAVTLAACGHVTPAPQGPRTYIAAHSSPEGRDNCRGVRLNNAHTNDPSVEAVLPIPERGVRCINSQNH